MLPSTDGDGHDAVEADEEPPVSERQSFVPASRPSTDDPAAPRSEDR
jgi:hypothetical protein